MRGGAGNGRPVVLVIGATGAQGGGVARHLVAGERFAVRALTRNPDGPGARALADAGVDVRAGDLEDVESVERALDGCYGVFGVTSYWEHGAREYEHGENLLAAVAGSGVEHFVFSTLPPIHDATGGELSSPHFDLKAKLEDRARSLGLPATYVHATYYFDNFIGFLPPRLEADGRWVFAFPQGDTPLAGVAAEDIGGVVAAVFQRPAQLLGRTVCVVGDELTPHEYAARLTGALGVTVAYRHVPREVFAAQDFPGAAELADMFHFYRTRVPDRHADLLRSRTLYPRMQTFGSWVDANREALARGIGLVRAEAG